MSRNYAAVSVKGSSVEEIRDYLDSKIGWVPTEIDARPPLDIGLEIVDDKEVLTFQKNHMREHNLLSDDDIYYKFGLYDFNVVIYLNFFRDSFFFYIADHFSDVLARFISKDLGVDTYVELPFAEDPYVIYKNGEVLVRFYDENHKFIKTRDWQPINPPI